MLRHKVKPEKSPGSAARTVQDRPDPLLFGQLGWVACTKSEGVATWEAETDRRTGDPKM